MNATRILLACLVLLAALLPAARPAQAAESYDNCTGFIDSLPAVIATQGVWCLRGNLGTAVTSGNAIEIAGNNITIDCNDFKIGGLAAGDASLTNGIYATIRQNVTVRNCNIRGFHIGIFLDFGGAGHLVEDNRLDNNLSTGIRVTGDNNRVRRNAVYDTGGAVGGSYAYGIAAYADVVDNTVDGVFATAVDTNPTGILLQGEGTKAVGNSVRGLVVAGAGSANGIYVGNSGHRIHGNDIAQSAVTAGSGIITSAFGISACSNNVVINYAGSGCTSSIDDASLP